MPDGIGLSEDQLGFVGVGYEDVRLREHDLEPVEIRPGPGRRHVEQGERPRGPRPPEPIGQLVGVEVGEDQEIADVQDAGADWSTASRSAATNPVLAPTVWMKRRSSPLTLTIKVWLVGRDGSTFSDAQSTPRLCEGLGREPPEDVGADPGANRRRDPEPGEVDGRVGRPAADIRARGYRRRSTRPGGASDPGAE